MNEQYAEAIRNRASMAVKRYHVMRMIRTQTVGEHSGAVATLLMQVYKDCPSRLLKAALTHDFHERATGDMPSTAKTLYPAMAVTALVAEDSYNVTNSLDWQLTNTETQFLKFCDYMELLMWCTEEAQMGNSFAIEGMVNIIPAIDALGFPNEIAVDIYNEAKTVALKIIEKEKK